MRAEKKKPQLAEPVTINEIESFNLDEVYAHKILGIKLYASDKQKKATYKKRNMFHFDRVNQTLNRADIDDETRAQLIDRANKIFALISHAINNLEDGTPMPQVNRTTPKHILRADLTAYQWRNKDRAAEEEFQRNAPPKLVIKQYSEE